MTNINAGDYVFTLTGGETLLETSLSVELITDGIIYVHLKLHADEPTRPTTMELTWKHPVVDIHACWHPGAFRNKGLQVDWGSGFKSKATSLAPVCCLYSLNGNNRHTFAFSDALNQMELKAGVNEETSTFLCSIQLFQEPSCLVQSYKATLRIDTRDIPYYECLEQVQQWWAEMPGFEPSIVPEAAKLPMYSTWYSFHQHLSPEVIEQQCLLAKEMGFESVIVDDGWQTADNARGYAYCGDWEVYEGKIPDMKAHVNRVHQMGLKYLLWYSVPFVGIHSKAWDKFEDKLMGKIERLGAGILDPRFPEVREYIIGIYEKALREWDIDGFKLDFVDSFNLTEESNVGGRDYLSVPEAVDCLLSDVMKRLTSMKPDIMIEFRQTYIGPLMRKYGNMFRATDCPNDAIENRSRTLDVRLLSGDTSVHADPIMWNPNEPVESAALQIINTLFSVPQISILLDRLPESHDRMLRFWLSFWREHRDVLLDGKLTPLNPELNYPLVIASKREQRITAVYADYVVNPGMNIPHQLIVVNGTLKDRVVIELDENRGKQIAIIKDCQGEIVKKYKMTMNKGIHSITVPPAGIISFNTI